MYDQVWFYKFLFDDKCSSCCVFVLIAAPCCLSLLGRCALSHLWNITDKLSLHCANRWADMKHLTSCLLLILFCVCRAKYLENKDNNRHVVTGRSDDDAQEPNSQSEEVHRAQELQSDIWAELMHLRDMVVEQAVVLKLLMDRATVAEKLVKNLQKENSGNQYLPQGFPFISSNGWYKSLIKSQTRYSLQTGIQPVQEFTVMWHLWKCTVMTFIGKLSVWLKSFVHFGWPLKAAKCCHNPFLFILLLLLFFFNSCMFPCSLICGLPV